MPPKPEALSNLLAEAKAARQRGDFGAEARVLEAISEHQPDSPEAWNAAGLSALTNGDYSAAADHFQQAVELDPKEPALWMNVATAQRALKDDEAERASLMHALDLDQLHFMARLRLAELQQRLGELAAAADSWRKVIGLSAHIEQIPPALAQVLADARLFVTHRMVAFEGAMDIGMAEPIGALVPTEKRRIRGAVDKMLGRRRIYNNECHGLHIPFLPADEFFDREHFPWLDAIEAKTDIIRAEFLNLYATSDQGTVRPYVRQDRGTPDNKWTPLDGSLDWGACFLWEYGARNERVCALCPETAALLETLPRNRIPRRAPSAFFSLLKPHTHIPPHTGVTNSRAIVHLPLIVPDRCGFRVGGEVRNWSEGEAFVFDDTIEHEAWNDSDDLRVVLIFDVWNPHLSTAEQDALIQLFEVMDRSGHDPAG